MTSPDEGIDVAPTGAELPSGSPAESPDDAPPPRPMESGPLGVLHRRLHLHVSVAGIIVLFASLVYTGVFSYISVAKYYSFNVTFGDLGLENQIYWLTLHGQYFSSGYTAIYPFPLETLSTFLLLPAYAIYPAPQTLLVLQSAFLGFAALPLYRITARITRRKSLGVLLSIAFLCYYPLQGANLFDFHPESMFPLFLFLALLGWLGGRKWMFIVFLIAASLIDIVALSIGILVVAWVALRERKLMQVAAGSAPTWRAWAVKVARSYGALFVGLLVMLVWLIFFQPQTYAGFSQTIGVSSTGVATSVYSKFAVLFFLLAPVAFLPLVADPELFLLVAAPYVGFVFLINGTGAAQSAFYSQYSLLPTPIIFFSTARMLRGIFPLRTGVPEPEAPEGPRSRVSRTLRGFARQMDRRGVRQLTVLVAFTAVLAGFYSPLSPVNGLVQGGVYQGSYHLPTDLDYNQHSRYLWHVIELIPPSASVLTQNSIPQVSGRTYYGVAGGLRALPGFTYDYILADSHLSSTISTWDGYSNIFPIVERGLQNGTYGIVAYADGVVLLKHGYTASPSYFVQPPPTVYAPSALSLFTGTRIAGGSELAHNASLGNSSYFFYGPYDTQILPGEYVASFLLSIGPGAAPSSRIMTIQVTSYSIVLAQQVLYASNFQPGHWTTFNLTYNLTTPTSGIQYRGVNVTNAASIYLSDVNVTYVRAV